jgi:hypothetical protein
MVWRKLEAIDRQSAPLFAPAAWVTGSIFSGRLEEPRSFIGRRAEPLDLESMTPSSEHTLTMLHIIRI